MPRRGRGSAEKSSKDKEKNPNTTYIVERILDQKIENDSIHYYIKWKDLPDSENSWVPRSHLTSVRKMVLDYERRLLEQCNQTESEDEDDDERENEDEDGDLPPLESEDKLLGSEKQQPASGKEKDGSTKQDSGSGKQQHGSSREQFDSSKQKADSCKRESGSTKQSPGFGKEQFSCNKQEFVSGKHESISRKQSTAKKADEKSTAQSNSKQAHAILFLMKKSAERNVEQKSSDDKDGSVCGSSSKVVLISSPEQEAVTENGQKEPKAKSPKSKPKKG